ncbi:undecaprenyldiphospho-muramoylpentapeptide beta-N-acetylglucosaminyltransferase [Blastochloris viridis]|uniref:UDP-N-acetylglucosamine--N-acetylmuramyl-(pentapeptide) pyrophosphoryl-undecaprenol N-acetylglucosamine transferase n=1 Tax=Blastochloris viridis TaxID=1079 RepID=A0A0H5BP02_BLAVI|nr:undecaprenyldiphospho-muramoylpentapeptide beta-N-acetylglucosaminyltransferase [Blastochloris viridis]ALK08202.1 UDP-N-acetylglucosamine--N-acetylmuramyl-(pentapeptide) pyrophosphoryl-undecaprenol N-acetylglucosamine transferase [Blastochloris viridis]BAR98533.1 UDP-N-acetylglucosamine--N-acetylmuramyl-(pentapeptide) pyrophosphoryl-undecaprenol N-acetylglucosamine transferase [Blastochloris viridis]CUU44124.1 UDP-N-acetylglucosamine--N-acetylmuramyl-(pentapeptide) pyrophosphoryl-undecaprenol
MSPPLILLAAGGTGGHLFPAEALATELVRRGAAVELVTDARAAAYAGSFPARARHVVAADTVRGRDPLALARFGLTMVQGLAAGWRLMGRVRPDAVVGFGGYPTVPPLLAAAWRGIPTVIHEQNAVPGRANRWLAPRASRIATGFPGVFAGAPALAAKAAFTGNPTRPAVIAASATAYDADGAADTLRLLVFGGSQGARVMSEIVPEAITRLPPELRGRLAIVQQARPEDLDAVATAYRTLGVRAEVAPFFSDLPARMARAHLVVCRAGASTVAELAVIGRPAILVPLPGALDQDQLANARSLAGAGAALLVPQSDFTPIRLADLVADLARAPARLAGMAAAAAGQGRPDASARLADLVLATTAAGSTGVTTS